MKANKQKTILLVEDEAVIAMLTSNQLNEKGYNIIYVSNGKEAIKTIQNKEIKVHLILMDIDLGKGIDGT